MKNPDPYEAYNQFLKYAHTKRLEASHCVQYLVWGSLIFALCAICAMGGLFYTVVTAEGRPSELYTVQTADAVYRDLTKGRSNGPWASYTTADGKKITFRGTFTEIEQ